MFCYQSTDFASIDPDHLFDISYDITGLHPYTIYHIYIACTVNSFYNTRNLGEFVGPFSARTAEEGNGTYTKLKIILKPLCVIVSLTAVACENSHPSFLLAITADLFWFVWIVHWYLCCRFTAYLLPWLCKDKFTHVYSYACIHLSEFNWLQGWMQKFRKRGPKKLWPNASNPTQTEWKIPI